MKQTISILVVAILISTAVAATTNKLFSPAFGNVEDPPKSELAIVPNPKTGVVKINFKAEKAMPATIVVLNTNGKIVLKQSAAAKAGDNAIPINNFMSLDEGAYNVYVKAGKKTYKSSYLLWK